MRISIAIATYNGDRFLREQLDSLYRQTRLPDEVVVSDDGSTDGTLAILDEYAERYGLRWEVNPGRHGVNGNFEHALRMATGDYVCICDQDDIWMESKVEELEQEIQVLSPQVPVVVSSVHGDIDATGRVISEARNTDRSMGWEENLMTTDHTQGCTFIMNRCLLDMALESMSRCTEEGILYDVLIDFTAAIFGEKINSGKALMWYRHHDKNVVARAGREPHTFWERVRGAQTYYPFLQDYRMHELAAIGRIYQNQAMRDEIRAWLDAATSVAHTNNIFKGLGILLRIPQIKRNVKVKMVILTPIMKSLKWIAKYQK